MYYFFYGEGRLFYGVKLRRVQSTDAGQRTTVNSPHPDGSLLSVVCSLLTLFINVITGIILFF